MPESESDFVFLQKKINKSQLTTEPSSLRIEFISYDSDASFFEEYFNFPLGHTSTSEVHKNGENILQKGVK